MTPEQRTIATLVKALEHAASHIRDMGCTCATNDQINRYHGTGIAGCTGDEIAREFETIARRVRRRTATQEPRIKR